MSIIACCVHDTEDNDRHRYTVECFKSVVDTVDLKKHQWFIINNGSCADVTEYLKLFRAAHPTVTLINLSENTGTARGINLAMKLRKPGQYFVKFDNDVTWGQAGWVEEMERVLTERAEIGILGLKREDVYGEMIPDGEILLNADIIGTCTMFSPALMDKIGAMAQISKYGFDDHDYSVRSIVAGFKNAFLPAIKIIHLDEGGTEYTEWKKREADQAFKETCIRLDLIKKGELSYYYAGE